MLSEDLISKIENGLDAMPLKPASRRELDLLLTSIEAKIRAAQERGATYAEIAKQISESGYTIKTSTLRLALQRHRKKEPRAKRVSARGNAGKTQHSTPQAKPPAPSVAPAASAAPKKTGQA